MMRVMNLNQEIRDRELQLVHPQTATLVPRRESMTSAEKQQDVGRLANDEPTGLQKRRCERRMRDAFAVQKAHQRRDTEALAALACNIHVVRASVLEREPHELAATLDLWPVKKPIRHTATPRVAPLALLGISLAVMRPGAEPG